MRAVTRSSLLLEYHHHYVAASRRYVTTPPFNGHALALHYWFCHGGGHRHWLIIVIHDGNIAGYLVVTPTALLWPVCHCYMSCWPVVGIVNMVVETRQEH